jgi:DnaJ-class molecular chaperone
MEILGLAESASKDEVVKAHRQLMHGLHPDRGGSDYLAKKINMAKDYLLKELQ